MIVEKLKGMLSRGELEDDGSIERAKEYIKMVSDAHQMEELSKNEAFKLLLEELSREFKDRMMKLTESDPELKAIRRMFVRTIGKEETVQRLERDIENFLKSGE